MGKFWTEGSICLEVLQTGFKIIFWFLCFHFSPSVRCVGCCAASGLSQDSPRRPTWYLFLKPSLQARCGLVHDATNVWSSTATWTENASSGVLQVSMNGALSSSWSRFWAEFQESYSKVNFPPAGSQSGTRLTRTGEEQIGWGRVELGPVVEPLSRWIQCLVDAADGLCLPAGWCWSTSLASSGWSSWSSSGWRGSFEQPPMFQSPPEQSLICNYLSANLNRWDVALLESDSLWLELVGDLKQNPEPIHLTPFFNPHSAVPLIVEQGWVSEQRQARERRRFHEAKLPFPRIPPSRWARLPANIHFSGVMVDEAPWQRWGCLSFASQRWKSCSCPAEPLFPRTRRGPWEQRISASEGKQISAREKTKRKWTECLISSNLVIKPEQSILCQLKKTPLLWINGQAGWPTMLQRLKRLK